MFLFEITSFGRSTQDDVRGLAGGVVVNVRNRYCFQIQLCYIRLLAEV